MTCLCTFSRWEHWNVTLIWDFLFCPCVCVDCAVERCPQSGSSSPNQTTSSHALSSTRSKGSLRRQSKSVVWFLFIFSYILYFECLNTCCTVTLLVTLLPCNKMKVFHQGVCMFSLYIYGFSPGTPRSSQSPKTWLLSQLVSLNRPCVWVWE